MIPLLRVSAIRRMWAWIYVEHLLADPDYVDHAMATHLAACSACAEETESLIALAADER